MSEQKRIPERRTLKHGSGLSRDEKRYYWTDDHQLHLDRRVSHLQERTSPPPPAQDKAGVMERIAQIIEGVEDPAFYQDILAASKSRRAQYPHLWKDSTEGALDKADAILALMKKAPQDTQ